MRRFLLFIVATAFTVASAHAGAIRWGITTVTGLPPGCEPEGHGYIVIDANPDCDTGGGTQQKICFCDSAGTGYNTLSINVADLLDVNAGTNLLNDLEEETHATEHIEAGADELTVEALGTACAEGQLFDANATTGVDCVTVGGQVSGFADNLVVAASHSGTSHHTVFAPSTLDSDYGDETITSDFDFGGGTVQVPNSATLPGTCEVGDGYMDTDETSGQRWFLCETANNFVLQGDGGGTPKFSYSWPAWNMNVDGTQCQDISQREIVAGGARLSTIRCADNTASEIQFNVQGQNYGGGTIVFQVSAINENATPSGNLVFNVQAQCHGDSDLHNATWGTLQTATIGFTTQDDEELAITAAVTPDGTCAADDHIYVRMLMDATGTTTEVADTRIVQVSMLEQ